MKKLLAAILLTSGMLCSGQNEKSNWFFGGNAGLKFMGDGTLANIEGSLLNTSEGSAVLSDAAGNLLLYTDGRNVYDRNHLVMPGGNYSSGTGLWGDPSATQSALAVPKPGDPGICYIFTVDEPHHQNAQAYPGTFNGTYANPAGSVPQDDDGRNNGLSYSVVNLQVIGSNGSLGDVVSRNNPLITYNPANSDEVKFKCSEKLAAARNAAGTGYWVVTHFKNRFYAFEVTAAGVSSQAVVSSIGPDIPLSGYRRNAIGALKISPDGTKLAVAHGQKGTVMGNTALNGGVYLYDFDLSTGIVSNQRSVSENTTPYGLEFSPSGNKLYVTYDYEGFLGGQFQYNLQAGDIASSGIRIGADDFGALQLAPNGKIYKAHPNSQFLAVIEYPEADGTDCGYNSFGHFIPYTAFSEVGLPNFVATGMTVLTAPEHNRSTFAVYPNPVRTEFHIKAYGLEEILGIQLNDMNGRLLKKWLPSQSYDLSALPGGLYILTIRTPGKTTEHKLLKE